MEDTVIPPPAPGRLRHAGLIMDGNGRWAQARGLPRSLGHKEGLNAARRLVAAASASGLEALSLFVFSTENWKRSPEEQAFLFKLMASHLAGELPFYRRHRLRVVASGRLSDLPEPAQRALEEVCAATAGHQGMTVNLAVNYGGRDEVLRAVSRWQAAGAALPLDEQALKGFCDQPQLPDLDLIIRTGGERRLSNFFLWQAAYAELYFSDTLWPDWDEAAWQTALAWYQGRQRRFGAA